MKFQNNAIDVKQISLRHVIVNKNDLMRKFFIGCYCILVFNFTNEDIIIEFENPCVIPIPYNSFIVAQKI